MTKGRNQVRKTQEKKQIQAKPKNMLIFHDKLTTAFSIEVFILIKVSVGTRCDLRVLRLRDYTAAQITDTRKNSNSPTFLRTCSTKIFRTVVHIVKQESTTPLKIEKET